MTTFHTAGDDRMAEKAVSSETIYQGRVVKLYLDTVQLPNGAPAKRELVRHPGAVAIVPIDAQGRVVLIRQYRYAAGRVLMEIPAGTLEPGEDPDDCAMRELQEEIGHRAGKLVKLGGIYVAPGYTTEYIHLYMATELSESRLEADADEFIEVHHHTWNEVMTAIQRGEIMDGKTISGVFLARELLNG